MKELRQKHADRQHTNENLSGNTLGSHVIEKVLKDGGSSGVFSAYSKDLEKNVALKIFHPRYSRYRFESEVDTHAMVASEAAHVVPLLGHDISHPNDNPLMPVVPYIVMEQAEGNTLMETVINNGALGLRTGISVIDRVSEPLDVLQKLGKGHSDVKPENMLFTRNREAGERISDLPVWLVDFGMAVDIDHHGTQSNGLGTVTYAAPEQMENRLTSTTDQFGLAATLSVVSMGERVIPIIDEKKYKAEVLSPDFGKYLDARIQAIFPEPYQPAIRRAMDPNPEKRYETSRAFTNDVSARHEEVMNTIHVPECTIVDLGGGNKRP